MPDELILPIVRKDGHLSDDASARVFATMLYPKDETRREQFVNHALAVAFVEGGVPPPLEISAVTIKGPSENEFMQEVKRSHDHGGRLAGQLLALLRQLDAHRPKDASVRKAIYLMNELHDKAKDAGTVNRSAGESTVRKAWSKYKSVCHLWAAWCILEFDENIFLNKNLPEFLAVAEWMREFAESHIPPSTIKMPIPLVKKGELWRAPEQLQLSRAEFQPPELDDEEIRFLSKYYVKF